MDKRNERRTWKLDGDGQWSRTLSRCHRVSLGQCARTLSRSFLTPIHHVRRDPRSQGRAQSLPPSEKVFTLAVSGQRLVVGTSDRSVLIYDVR
jgi:hypothetical protein